MQGNCELLLFSLTALAMSLVPANIGLGGTQEQVSRTAAQSETKFEDICQSEIKFEDICLGYPTVATDACYIKLMTSYACAVQVGGEAERNAKNKLENFYKALHNNTTVGIEKVYNKAKELGCKEKSPPSTVGIEIEKVFNKAKELYCKEKSPP